MAKYSMECPECGNWVEGKVKATLARKLTRGAVRKGASSAIGATIGTVILPGVGTVVGSGIGIAIGALMEDHIQEASDLAAIRTSELYVCVVKYGIFNQIRCFLYVILH
jgi:hypothetical protein